MKNFLIRLSFVFICVFLFSKANAAELLVGPFTTNSSGQIVDSNSKPTAFNGVSWFGFNGNNHVLDGLYASDFDTMLKQIKALGFNAVRMPIQFDLVENTNIKPSSINTSCTGPNSCNMDVPQDSAFHTLQWVVQQFTNNGIFVLLDDHYEDTTFETDPTAWLNDWVLLANTFKNNPLVGFDLLNEPDSHGVLWEGTPSLSENYLAAIRAIYAVDPHKLIFIEGTGQGSLASDWGDGFATDDATINAGISNPKNFFTQLLSEPAVSQIVISPHIYGPDGTNNMGPDYTNQSQAFAEWDRLVGYLNQKGFCANNNCHIFPVGLGEFGGKFDSADPYYQKDVATNVNIATYLKTLSQANWFYWDWNPNSGNTGGILKDDWKTIDCNKINFLRNNLGFVAQGFC